MACHLFGAVSINDPDFGNKLSQWTASCISAGQHPRGTVDGDMYTMFCCDNATDVPPGSTAARLISTLSSGFVALGIVALLIGIVLSRLAPRE